MHTEVTKWVHWAIASPGASQSRARARPWRSRALMPAPLPAASPTGRRLPPLPARLEKSLDPGDLAGQQPREERHRLADVARARHARERDPEMREEKEQDRGAHQDLPGAVEARAGSEDRPAAGQLLFPEGVPVQALVAVGDPNVGLVPERSPAREHRQGERRVLARVGLRKARRADGVAPVDDRHGRNAALGAGGSAADPFGVVQEVVELTVAARPAVDDPAAHAGDRGIRLEDPAGLARSSRARRRRPRPGRRAARRRSPRFRRCGLRPRCGASRWRAPARRPCARPRPTRRRRRRRRPVPPAVARSGPGPTPTASATVRSASRHGMITLARINGQSIPRQPAAGSGSERDGRRGAAATGASRSSARREKARWSTARSTTRQPSAASRRWISAGRRTAMCSGNCLSRKPRAFMRST